MSQKNIIDNLEEQINEFYKFINILKSGKKDDVNLKFIIEYAKSNKFALNIDKGLFLQYSKICFDKNPVKTFGFPQEYDETSYLLESVFDRYIDLLENETDPENICFDLFKDINLEYNIYTILNSKNYFIVKKAYKTFTNYFQTGKYHIRFVKSVEIFKYLYKHLKNRIDNENTCLITNSSLYYSNNNPNFLIFEDSIETEQLLREYMWKNFPNHINYKATFVKAVCSQSFVLFDFWKDKCLKIDLSDEVNFDPYDKWGYTDEQLYEVCYTYGDNPNDAIIDEIIKCYPEYLKFIPFRRIIRDYYFDPLILLYLEKMNIFNLQPNVFSWQFLIECATNIIRQYNKKEFKQLTYYKEKMDKVVKKLHYDITNEDKLSINTIFTYSIVNKELDEIYARIINKLKTLKKSIVSDSLYYTYIECKVQYDECNDCIKNGTFCKYTSHAFYDSYVIRSLYKILDN